MTIAFLFFRLLIVCIECGRRVPGPGAAQNAGDAPSKPPRNARRPHRQGHVARVEDKYATSLPSSLTIVACGCVSLTTLLAHCTIAVDDHMRITRRAREQFANDTYKDQVREARNKVIDQDNELLLRGLFNVADRRNEYNDELFLERIDRVKNARGNGLCS